MTLKFSDRYYLLAWMHDATGLLLDALEEERDEELHISDAGFNVCLSLIRSIGNNAVGLEDKSDAEAQLMEGLQSAIDHYRQTYSVQVEAQCAPEGVTLQ
jgi:hypothetical protein